MKLKFWNKSMGMVVIMALLVMLVACGGTKDNTSNATAKDVPKETAPQKTAEKPEKKLDKTLTLRMAHGRTQNDPVQREAEIFAKNVEERTNGEIKIKVFPNSSLGSGPDLQQQAQLGNPVMVYTNPDYLVDLAPDIGILSGPFLTDSWDQLKKIIHSDFMEEQNELLKKGGLQVLSFNWYFGQRHLITKKEVHTPDDLKGVAMRSPGSPMFVKTIAAMGANPTPLAWAEVYSALEQGVVDAAESPFSALYTSSLYEPAKYIIKTGHFNQVNGWVMSDEIFSSLPKEYQDIMIEEMTKAGERMSQSTIDEDKKFEEKLKQAGAVIIEPDIEAFRKATVKVYDEFASQWSDGLYDRVRALLK